MNLQINRIYKNGGQLLELVSLHTTDLKDLRNIAILRRLNPDTKTTRDFVVVNGLRVFPDNNTCDWAFSYVYDLESLTDASRLFAEKIR